jgi:transcription termination factor Rho
MKNQFNKQNLEKLGIFELRNLAREVGVHSPTTYRKEELIENILLIIEGKKEPHIAKSKQGRPPKSIQGVNNLLNIFIPKSALEEEKNNYNELSYDVSSLSKITAMDSNLLSMQYQAEDDLLVSGIIEVFEEGYAFCYEKGFRTKSKEHNFFISNIIVASYHLKSGDVIRGHVKKISDEKPYVVYKIDAINHTLIDKFQTNRKEFGELVAKYPVEKIKFDVKNKTVNHLFMEQYLPLGKGQRAVVMLDKALDYTPLTIYFLNSILKQDNLEKRCVLIDERPEDITEYYSLLHDTKIIHTNVEDEPYQAVQKLELSLEHAKRKVEDGKDVVLFISNLNKLQNLYRKKFIMSHQGFDNQDNMYSIAMIKKLLSSARNTENAGTLTIIALAEQNLDKQLEIELKELCNMCILLNKNNYMKENKIWFDVQNSETRKAYFLLTKQENEALQAFKNKLLTNDPIKVTEELEQKLLNQLN